MSDFTLYHGDCLDVLKQLEDNSIDAAIIDPPYGMGIDHWDILVDIENVIKQIKRVTKKFFAVFGVMPYLREWDNQATKQGFKFLEHVTWVKRVITVKPRYMAGQSAHHDVYKRLDTCDNLAAPDDVNFTNVWSFLPEYMNNFNKGDNVHPTIKPTVLLNRLVEMLTNEGDTVLDCFMGSGTTGIACANTGRNFIGVELDPEYFALSQERITKANLGRQGEIIAPEPLPVKAKVKLQLSMF